VNLLAAEVAPLALNPNDPGTSVAPQPAAPQEPASPLSSVLRSPTPASHDFH